ETRDRTARRADRALVCGRGRAARRQQCRRRRRRGGRFQRGCHERHQRHAPDSLATAGRSSRTEGHREGFRWPSHPRLIMAIAGPRLRSDLVISQQENAGRPAVVVKDPATGQFFRLKETESYILEQLDGSTSLDEVRKRVEQKFADPLDADTLQQFVTSLSRLGLLEKEQADSGHLSHRSRQRWSLFNIRLKIFDPDRLFTVLIPRLGIFFTPQFVYLSAALIL